MAGFLGTSLVLVAVVIASHLIDLFRIVFRALAGMALVACFFGATEARASELSAAYPASHGIVVHGPDEVLNQWCHTDADGRLWFSLPNGPSFELVTSADDPAIANHGDHQFHPFDLETVREALAGIRYPLDGVSADVFILPFPRRLGLSSCAGPGLVLLSPGVWPIPAGLQHAEVAHEMGHIVQYVRMPDADQADWTHYREMRGIEDETTFNATACHADRPHEIFAEDFRLLFGSPLAVTAAGIENSTIAPANAVPGLETFLGALTGPGVTGLAVTHEAHGLAFARVGVAPQSLGVYDVTGRRIASLAPLTVAGGQMWHWDGRDLTGRVAPAGMVFVRLADGSAVARAFWRP